MPKKVPGGRVEKEQILRKDRLLKALSRNNCLVFISCKKAKVDSQTYYRYLEEDQEFAEKVAALKEGVIDGVENNLFKSINSGEYIPAMFYLKCQAKKRGYLEKQEIKLSGDTEAPIVPDSVVQAALATIIKQEEVRLSRLPKGDCE